MVKSATSLTRSGLRDWLWQRFSALLIGVYVIFIIGFIMAHPGMNFAIWQNLFCQAWMRIATVIVLLAILIHAYVGMWTIATDYLKNTSVRMIYLALVILILAGCLIAGIMILWGSNV